MCVLASVRCEHALPIVAGPFAIWTMRADTRVGMLSSFLSAPVLPLGVAMAPSKPVLLLWVPALWAAGRGQVDRGRGHA